MMMATRCLAVQFVGQPLPPGFTSVNVFSITSNSGGDLITVSGPTANNPSGQAFNLAVYSATQLEMALFMDNYHVLYQIGERRLEEKLQEQL